MQASFLFVIRKWVRVGSSWKAEDEPKQSKNRLLHSYSLINHLVISPLKLDFPSKDGANSPDNMEVILPLQFSQSTDQIKDKFADNDRLKTVNQDVEKLAQHSDTVIERPHFSMSTRCHYLAVSGEFYITLCQRLERTRKIRPDAQHLICCLFRPLLTLFGDHNDQLQKKLVRTTFKFFKVGYFILTKKK